MDELAKLEEAIAHLTAMSEAPNPGLTLTTNHTSPNLNSFASPQSSDGGYISAAVSPMIKGPETTSSGEAQGQTGPPPTTETSNGAVNIAAANAVVEELVAAIALPSTMETSNDSPVSEEANFQENSTTVVPPDAPTNIQTSNEIDTLEARVNCLLAVTKPVPPNPPPKPKRRHPIPTEWSESQIKTPPPKHSQETPILRQNTSSELGIQHQEILHLAPSQQLQEVQLERPPVILRSQHHRQSARGHMSRRHAVYVADEDEPVEEVEWGSGFVQERASLWKRLRGIQRKRGNSQFERGGTNRDNN